MAISPVNIGNNAGVRGVASDMDNALKVFSGLVLTAFERKNIGVGMIKVMTAGKAKQVQFPVIAQLADTAGASYVVGTDVSTSLIPVKERVITIGAPTYVALNISGLEEKVLGYETRGELSKQLGESLATKIDKAVFAQVLVASQTSGTIGGEVMQPDGSEVNNDAISGGTTPEAKGDALLAALFEANTLLKQKDVAGEPIFVTTPANYNYLVQGGKGIHKDYTSGNGGLDTGNIIQIAGIKIMWSNHLPVGTSVDVAGTAKKLQGLLFTPDCVGMAKMADVTTEIDKLPTRIDEDLIKVYYWNAMGVLNPACAVAITGGAFA